MDDEIRKMANDAGITDQELDKKFSRTKTIFMPTECYAYLLSALSAIKAGRPDLLVGRVNDVLLDETLRHVAMTIGISSEQLNKFVAIAIAKCEQDVAE